MDAVVVDTNVLAVANFQAEQAGPDCVLACIAALETAKRQQIVVIDSRAHIFSEYFRYASRSGQPGLGDAFIKWLWNNQAYATHCEQVDLTPNSCDEGDFQEFPDDRDLDGFDRSDRKFVAVAIGSKHDPKVLNATDTDWWNFRAALERHGVIVNFLCLDLVLPKYHP